MRPNQVFKLVIVGIGAVIALLMVTTLIKVRTVSGNELGVQESWTGGVKPEALPPRTYFLFPGFLYTLYTYPISSEIFVMNDTPSSEEKTSHGREKDAYLVQSKEGQNMHISLNVRWRRNPLKVVQLHKTVRDDIEEKLIRPVVMRVVKNHATTYLAIDAYSGEGLVKLQREIQAELMDPQGELGEAGVIVDNFVIEGIRLDDEYINEIRAKQVATQKKLRADEETKAANAEALRATAIAQADLNTRVTQAERDKEVLIKNAEAAKQQVVLQAQGEKEAGENRAAGIRAVGTAEADVKKAQLAAWAVPGADNFVRVESAKYFSTAFSGVKGFLPESMRFNVISTDWQKAVMGVMTDQSNQQNR